jgi:predicted nicotinamide N-methyase
LPTRFPSKLPRDLAALDRRFTIATVEVLLAGHRVSLERPRSADELISEADFAKDERLPYWADLWPSSTALAASVIGLAGTGRRALELGCGVGLVTIAALRAGFDVLATDYYADALLFTRRNSRRVIGREPVTQLVDWRAFPADLGQFDLLLASDVLYERDYATLIADAIVASLAPGGVALVADPGRAALLTFITACEQRRCRVGIRERVPWQEGGAKQTITIHEVQAPGGE